jgi:hypothetical protein
MVYLECNQHNKSLLVSVKTEVASHLQENVFLTGSIKYTKIERRQVNSNQAVRNSWLSQPPLSARPVP